MPSTEMLILFFVFPNKLLLNPLMARKEVICHAAASRTVPATRVWSPAPFIPHRPRRFPYSIPSQALVCRGSSHTLPEYFTPDSVGKGWVLGSSETECLWWGLIFLPTFLPIHRLISFKASTISSRSWFDSVWMETSSWKLSYCIYLALS